MGVVANALALLQQFAGDPFFERHCHGKIPYDNEPAAKLAAKNQHKRVKRRYDAYQCQFCKQWHIGRHRRKPR